MKQLTIVVPVYRERPTGYEHISIDRLKRVCPSRDIVFVMPDSLKDDFWKEIIPGARTERFDDRYFSSIAGYNRLMMSREFYSRFLASEFILIYQLDAYIFVDRLDEWCEKGYDYVGAPWLVRPVYKIWPLKIGSKIKHWCRRMLGMKDATLGWWKVGNGGFSLRRVRAHLEAVSRLSDVVTDFLNHPDNHLYNEDVFFSTEVNRRGLDFRYPTWKEGLEFAFDKYPELCFSLNGNQLPMGCHSWYKRRMRGFWFPIILYSKPIGFLKKITHKLKGSISIVRSRSVPPPVNPNDIPVIINNFNRLTDLVKLIESLRQRDINNIIILDNASTYPPLLKWYETTPFEVIKIGKNLGFKALWKYAPARKRFCKGWYVYTDSDVMLSQDCPADVMIRLLNVMLSQRPKALKVGLSIKIDDIPGTYALKDDVETREAVNWIWPQENGTIFSAPTDTTFALYRPKSGLNRSRADETYRLAPPYSIAHLPWYVDSANPTDEEKYYITHARHITSWTSKTEVRDK